MQCCSIKGVLLTNDDGGSGDDNNGDVDDYSLVSLFTCITNDFILSLYSYKNREDTGISQYKFLLLLGWKVN